MAVTIDTHTLNTSQNFSYTTSGSNRWLGIWVVTGDSKTFNSVTYNAVSLTTGAAVSNGSIGLQIAFFYMAAPPSGAHTIDVNISGGGGANYQTYVVSLNGTDQTTPIDGQNASGNNSTSHTSTITATQAADLYVLCGLSDNGASITPTSPAVALDSGGLPSSAQSATMYSGPFAGSGANSIVFTTGSSQNTIWVNVAVKDVSPPVTGPVNVKTFDGVTQSTGIKTYFGVALASTKSVDGVF